MRPVTFCSKKELESWGNEKIELLLNHYGKQVSSKPRGDQGLVTVEPLVNIESARREWDMLKTIVVNEGYPRDKMQVLWALINKHHKEQVPNLIKLAALALTAPIHTADCERGFSAQNLTKTSSRNRLSSARVDDLLMVKLEGGDMENFDFNAALSHWMNRKERKIFQ